MEQYANKAVAGKRRISNERQKPQTQPADNAQKDPDDWVSGDDPMTGAQASYLKTLCEQAGKPEAFSDSLNKADASKLIDELRSEVGVN